MAGRRQEMMLIGEMKDQIRFPSWTVVRHVMVRKITKEKRAFISYLELGWASLSLILVRSCAW